MISAADTVPWRIDAATRRTSVPVVGDQAGVDAVGEELVERAVVLLRAADGEQPLVKHVADPWCEAEAQGRVKQVGAGSRWRISRWATRRRANSCRTCPSEEFSPRQGELWGANPRTVPARIVAAS